MNTATRVVAVLIVIVILVAGILGIRALRSRLNQPSPNEQAQTTPTPTPDINKTWNQTESETIAHNFVINSPTYHFDGSNLKLENSAALGCTGCFSFTYSFMSSHGGYGNRNGQMVTQVITSHRIVVTTQQGQITSAVIDGKFDELNQATK